MKITNSLSTCYYRLVRNSVTNTRSLMRIYKLTVHWMLLHGYDEIFCYYENVRDDTYGVL